MILPTRTRAVAGVAATFVISAVIGTTVLNGTFAETFDLYPLFEPVRERLFPKDEAPEPAAAMPVAAVTTPGSSLSIPRTEPIAADPLLLADGTYLGATRARENEEASYRPAGEFGTGRPRMQSTATSGSFGGPSGGGAGGGGGGAVSSGSRASSNSGAPPRLQPRQPQRSPRNVPAPRPPAGSPPPPPPPPAAAAPALTSVVAPAAADTSAIGGLAVILEDPNGPMSMSPTPEPGSLLLMTTAALGAYGFMRRRTKTRK